MEEHGREYDIRIYADVCGGADVYGYAVRMCADVMCMHGGAYA